MRAPLLKATNNNSGKETLWHRVSVFPSPRFTTMLG